MITPSPDQQRVIDAVATLLNHHYFHTGKRPRCVLMNAAEMPANLLEHASY